MLCEKCNKSNAEIYYSEVVNGKETDIALCRNCAKEMHKAGELSFTVPPLFTDSYFGESLGSFIGSMFVNRKTDSVAANEKRCDLCGMTFTDLRREGKAGCPRCYDTFADVFERTVAGIHGDTKHTGKVSAKYQTKMEALRQIDLLRKEISAAVSAEDYEKAAELRDRIRAIENSEGDE